jgi:hypothetical protein
MLNKILTMRTAFNDYSVFSQFYLNTIANPDERLVQLNSVTGYFLKNKQLGQIENWTQATSLSFNDQQFDEGSQFIIDLNLPLDYVIYPASRVSFYKEFFSQYSPILARALYSAMDEQGLILGVGAGRGYATLFKYPVTLDEDYYKQFIVSYNNSVYKKAVDELSLSRKPASLTAALNYAALTQDEIAYYIACIADQEKLIQSLNDKISLLEKQNYITTQLTWR